MVKKLILAARKGSFAYGSNMCSGRFRDYGVSLLKHRQRTCRLHPVFLRRRHKLLWVRKDQPFCHRKAPPQCSAIETVALSNKTPVWSRYSNGLKRRGLQARLVSSDCLAAKMSFLTLRYR